MNETELIQSTSLGLLKSYAEYVDGNIIANYSVNDSLTNLIRNRNSKSITRKAVYES